MENKKVISEVSNTVIELLSCPELSCLPRYNREDVVAVFTFEIIELLGKLGVSVPIEQATPAVTSHYRKVFPVEKYNTNLIDAGNTIN